MSGYLILAENVIFRNNKLTCINMYDKLSTIAMPAEFRFDLAILCGPNWSVGQHKLSIKAKGSNGKEVSIGELTVDVPNEDFVYNAYANDCKILMDYSVESLTVSVYDDNEEIISRKYPVISMLVPQKREEANVSEAKSSENSEENEQDLEKSFS